MSTEGQQAIPEPPPDETHARGKRWPWIVTAVVIASIGLGIGLALVWSANRSHPLPPPKIRRDVNVYRGLGAWIDVHDDAAFDDPEGAVRTMAANGVDTLYLETSNFQREFDIDRPEQVARFIEAAHAADMAVVAWYLPGFQDPNLDIHRSLAAIRFETPGGQGFDGFGLDIEATEVKPIGQRVKVMARVSTRIREAVGDDYALAAIIPSPVGMDSTPTYWGEFPYEPVAAIYDIMLPMAYSTYRAHGQDETYAYIAECIRIIRSKTGDPEIPIHVIGGIAGGLTMRETRGLVEATRQYGVMGTSLYDFATTNADSWPELERAPDNPVQHPALPIPLDSDLAELPLGDIPGGDRTHPAEVSYVADGLEGKHHVRFEAYGADADDVEVRVNGRVVGSVAAPTAVGEWTRRQEVFVPARLLRGEHDVVEFVFSGTPGSGAVWGIRSVSLDA